MNWLIWGTLDFDHGLGGIEVYSRCIARELRKLGVSVTLSNRPDAVATGNWDVVQTHGTCIFPKNSVTQGIRLHTLHGSTFERMWACREFFWLGGYFAGLRERRGILEADGVLSVHGDVHWSKTADRLGKPFLVCGNGWDAAPTDQVSSKVDVKKPAILFIGRGDDPMKNAPFFSELAEMAGMQGETWNWYAAPGTGFENDEIVQPTGRLTSAEVRDWIESVDAVVLPSLYEGLPLVVLESLAAGTPTLASTVGGIGTLPNELQGFTRFSDRQPSEWLRILRDSVADQAGREKRKTINREHLDSWADVAVRALRFAETISARKKGNQ
jgi:hypothetical protein